MASARADSGWQLLSNHGKVLVCVARDPELRVSEIAGIVEIKERAVQRILAELRRDGFISSTRDGRRNRYRVNRRARMAWPRNGGAPVGALIDALDS